MEIIDGVIKRNETNENAMGGTELMATRMAEWMDADVLNGMQIIHSRPRKLLDDKFKVLVLHDLPQDPEVQHLANGGWDRYDLLVFVSNHQMHEYNRVLGVPYSKSVVLRNAIFPFTQEPQLTVDGPIRLIYTSTPHRGLNILTSVVQWLNNQEGIEVELDVYSSFDLYGWGDRDKPYAKLFETLESLPYVRNHGTVSNSEIRGALLKADVFAYPSIWQETSCLCLIEAMAAGLVCVHPNYGALPETSCGWTHMYQWSESPSEHARAFAIEMLYALNNIRQHRDMLEGHLQAQQDFANSLYSIVARTDEWNRVFAEKKAMK